MWRNFLLPHFCWVKSRTVPSIARPSRVVWLLRRPFCHMVTGPPIQETVLLFYVTITDADPTLYLTHESQRFSRVSGPTWTPPLHLPGGRTERRGHTWASELRVRIAQPCQDPDLVSFQRRTRHRQPSGHIGSILLNAKQPVRVRQNTVLKAGLKFY